MSKYVIALAMLLAVGAGCTVNFDTGTDNGQNNNGNTDNGSICQNTCGNGTCEEIVCQGSGCPCAETPTSCPQDCAEDGDSAEAEKDNLIFVTAPLINAEVSSPLTIAGEARGTWYFEATFPVKLYDGNNQLLAEGYATAQGDWMTEDFVPFTASLTFANSTTPTGTLVLEKSNASGLPENDDSLSFPVHF